MQGSVCADTSQVTLTCTGVSVFPSSDLQFKKNGYNLDTVIVVFVYQCKHRFSSQQCRCACVCGQSYCRARLLQVENGANKLLSVSLENTDFFTHQHIFFVVLIDFFFKLEFEPVLLLITDAVYKYWLQSG